jgi:hypothetical protein
MPISRAPPARIRKKKLRGIRAYRRMQGLPVLRSGEGRVVDKHTG